MDDNINAYSFNFADDNNANITKHNSLREAMEEQDKEQKEILENIRMREKIQKAMTDPKRNIRQELELLFKKNVVQASSEMTKQEIDRLNTEFGYGV